MNKGFKNTFASATMPMRNVIGTRGARESMTSWGKLVAILDAVPARKSVIVMATRAQKDSPVTLRTGPG